MISSVQLIGVDSWAKFFDDEPAIARRAARLAINQTVDREAVPLARRDMLQQVAWPKGYLTETVNGRQRFGIAVRASDRDLEAIVRGRFQPTSLARFTNQRPSTAQRRRSRRGKASGVKVTISPGKVVSLPNAFLIRLRGGNHGLAIRLRPGETLRGSVGAKIITTGALKGLALLYGPSVEQVFRTVSRDTSYTAPVSDYLQREFRRQFTRLSA